MTGGPDRDELRAQLVAARIAGDVATTREDNLRKYAMFANREVGAMFGLSPRGRWDSRDLLDLMAQRVGVSPDPAYRHGPDRIDPDVTIDGLDRLAAVVAGFAHPGARVLLATGHPAGLLPVHLAIAAGLRSRGARLLTPGKGFGYETHTRTGRVTRHIRYIHGVATVSTRGELNHTHSPRPMEGALAALAAEGEARPDLVVADHGWAGAAGQAGVPAVGFADSNDPGLFVAEAEGTLLATVPLDDNVEPHLYEPLTAYLLDAAGLAPQPT